MTTLKTKDFWAVKSRKRGFPDESLVDLSRENSGAGAWVAARPLFSSLAAWAASVSCGCETRLSYTEVDYGHSSRK
jgi:hypothetical protein